MAWALETTPETLALTMESPGLDREAIDDLMARLQCPLLVTQGDRDELIPPDRGRAFADATGAELVELVDVGHCPHARHPVRFNELLHDFAARAYGRPVGAAPWRRAIGRRRRALYVSSPIGLGHAWRDVAIARELRALHPDLQIDWLAQDPVTRVLETCGETIHPASALLANESRHIAAESREHELNVFQAWRRMDEILLANFMVFRDLVRDEPYDLWIGDEAWELDYYLHENPELKTAPYAFLTDFVGWLPMPEGGDDEARLTADYNAEMIEQIARFPRVRDRAIFVGGPQDVVARDFGDGLPAIGPWVQEHFDFSGYVLAPDAGAPASPADRAALRAELGYRDDETVCLVTVGGSGVGAGLLRRVIDAYPAAARARARAAHDRRVRPAHRPRLAALARGPRARQLRRPPRAPSRRVRRRRHPGRADDVHGARGGQDAVRLLPPAPALRAEPARPPSPRALSGGPRHGPGHGDARDHRRRDRRGARRRRPRRRGRARRRRARGGPARRAALAGRPPGFGLEHEELDLDVGADVVVGDEGEDVAAREVARRRR